MGKRVIIIFGSAIVAACGGGSGGGGAPTGTTPVASAVLTTDNAVTVAGSTTDAALFSAEFDELGNLGIIGSPGGMAVVQSGGDASVTLAKQTASLRAETAEVSIGPETQDCPFGGQMTISAEIRDPETLTAGDTFSTTYLECDFGEGMVANGGIAFTVTSFDGDLNAEDFSMGLNMTITDLSVVELGEEVTFDGDLSMSMSFTATGSVMTMSGSSLTLSDGVEFFELSEFSTTATIDLSVFPQSFSVESNGFLMSSEFDGEVQFATTVALQGSGEENPGVGEFLITGANDATIRVIPMDGQNVRLELDLDGDGAVDPDGTLDMTWQELLDTPA